MSQQLQHKHYLGSAHSFEILTDKDETAGKYVRPDVTVLKTFFINSKVNVNNWQAEWEGLKEDAKELPGVPLVLQEDLQHPKFSVQEYYDRGTIFDYDIDEVKQQIIVYVRITDPKVTERIKSGELQYVSPAVIPRGSETLRQENGVDVLERTLPLHLAIVGDPAYGKDEAKMTHLCTGDGIECHARLKMMTASATKVNRIIQREHELLNRGIPEKEVHKMLEDEFGADFRITMFESDNAIDSLTQTPLIKKMIASVQKMKSDLKKVKEGSVLHEHLGQKGRWINVQNQDVFVAENQTIKEAMLKQCGCTTL
jgi:hypothetical protein